MPAIRSIKSDENGLEIIDKDFQIDKPNKKKFLSSEIPAQALTPSGAEQWLKNALRNLTTEYQIDVHVFSISPFSITIYAADLGIPTPLNWWEE